MSIIGKIGKALSNGAGQVIDQMCVEAAYKWGQEDRPRPVPHADPAVNTRVMRAWEDGRAEMQSRRAAAATALSGNLRRE